MKTTDSHAKKVTVSLPGRLYEWGEEQRAHEQMTRSEFVAALYRRYLEEIETQRRIDRYAAAYARQPETAEERAWAEHSSEILHASYGDK